MTLQEIENELKSLREQEEARKKNWRMIRKTAAFCGILFILGGSGLLVFSLAYPNGPRGMSQTAIMFIILTLPMSLLAAALR